jgi:acyl-CoA thioesterase FadM
MILESGEVGITHIDSNGHANVSFYTEAFDKATFKIQNLLGIPHGSSEIERMTFFASRMLVSYKSELFLGAKWEIDTYIYFVTDERIGFFHKLISENKSISNCFMLCFAISLPNRNISKISNIVLENSKKYLISGIRNPFQG